MWSGARLWVLACAVAVCAAGTSSGESPGDTCGGTGAEDCVGAGGFDAGTGDAGSSDTGAHDAGGSSDGGGGDTCGDAGAEDCAGAPCTTAGSSCSDDAVTLTVCAGGRLAVTDCYAGGMLCEDGACVPPWRYGSPAFSRCDSDPRATPETLAAKAAYFDGLARRLHVHPQHNIINSVYLKAAAGESTATWQDVERWEPGENDGLWGSSYIASQAFRYAATKDAEALDNIRVTLAGMARQFEITGVPGLVTREYITPGIDGMGCPQDPASYIPSVDKKDNKWLKVDDAGCVETYDGARWVVSGHCMDTKFAGYCWLDNVSKDEYSGHFLAMGVIGKLVDDPAIRATVAGIAGAAAGHLIDHGMQFVDWDGRVTEHGRIHAMALDDYPGFNAALALSWTGIAAALTGDPALTDFHDNCLLQIKRTRPCVPGESDEPPVSYLDYLENHVLYVTQDGCTDNYNNFNMIFMAMLNLLWYENRPEIRQRAQQIYEDTMMQALPPQKRQMIGQRNAFFNFIYAAMKRLGHGSTGPALQAVEDAVCALREFPASKAAAAHDTTVLPLDCKGRLGGDLTADPVSVADRCLGIFEWTDDPYDMESCGADPRQVAAPVDYLLAYWMGRYFGFVPGDL